MKERTATWINATALLLAAFLLTHSGCGGDQKQPHRGAPPVPEPEEETATCDSVCAHLDELGCEQFDPPPVQDVDPTCLEFCTVTMENGKDLHLTCVSKVRSCDQVDPASTGKWCG